MSVTDMVVVERVLLQEARDALAVAAEREHWRVSLSEGPWESEENRNRFTRVWRAQERLDGVLANDRVDVLS